MRNDLSKCATDSSGENEMEIDDEELMREAKEDIFFDERQLGRTEFDAQRTKRVTLPENATVVEITEVIVDRPVEVEGNAMLELLNGIKSTGSLIETFGHLKFKMRCPYCNGAVVKAKGPQLERLKCNIHGMLGKFDLANQIPKEIFKAYLEKGGETRRKEWIDEFNALSEDEDEPMDLIECFQNRYVLNKTTEKSDKKTVDVKNVKLVEKPNVAALVKENEKMEIEKTEPTKEKDVVKGTENNNVVLGNASKSSLEALIEGNSDKILFPSEEISAGKMETLTTLEKIAIDKPLKDVIWHLLNVNGKIAEKLRIEGYSKEVKDTTTSNNDLNNGNDKGPRSYAEALMQGIKKSEVSKGDIRKVCAFTYNPRIIESYKTIHFRGIRKNEYNLIWKVLEDLGIDKKRVKMLQFVNIDTLEIDLFESYVSEVTTILESAHKKQAYEDLVIKRIKFNPLDAENIKNPTPAEIFRQRLTRKLETIAKLKERAPHLTRLEKYVQKQLQCMSLDIVMRPPLNYDDTLGAHINLKLEQQMVPQKVNEPLEQPILPNQISKDEDRLNVKVDHIDMEVVNMEESNVIYESQN